MKHWMTTADGSVTVVIVSLGTYGSRERTDYLEVRRGRTLVGRCQTPEGLENLGVDLADLVPAQ